ncbi:MAG: SUMF1/EgtB/PvdO family nonheme iron enzyme [Planctomycetes bacterium]|nr:SUMF1/EgtB/PvdO family nonheme iron enzyme [Planctomycetota bacterium]
MKHAARLSRTSIRAALPSALFPRRFPLPALLLSLGLLGAASSAVAQEGAARDAAQARFAAATERENSARLELWRAHNEHQALWQRLRAPARSEALTALGTALAGAASSARPERAALERALSEALGSSGVGARAAADLLPRLVQAIVAGQRQVPPLEPQLATTATLEKLYPADGAWIDAWNGGLAGVAASAKAYATAREERLSARKALLGEIRPVATHPAARQLPDGMVLVPGGSYTLGPAKGWTTGVAAAARTVIVKSFYLDRFEVTNAQYREFLGSLTRRKAEPFYPSTWSATEDGQLPQIPEGLEDHPVTGVDLVAAMAYAEWRDARLPTEEEWEVAAAGPAALEYPWGESYEPGKANSLDQLRGLAARVGAFAGDVSGFGAFDLAGNASEWTASLPTGEVLRKPPTEGQVRNVIVRGGSFLSEDPRESLSSRYRWPQPARGTQRSDLGFRCAKSARER